jgi:hypothetical protein
MKRPVLFGQNKTGRMRQAYGRGEVHIGFWWGNPKERDHFEDLDVDGRIILKCKR